MDADEVKDKLDEIKYDVVTDKVTKHKLSLAVINIALTEARNEALRESQAIADEHCKYVTRKCSPEHEELCKACEISSTIMGRVGK